MRKNVIGILSILFICCPLFGDVVVDEFTVDQLTSGPGAQAEVIAFGPTFIGLARDALDLSEGASSIITNGALSVTGFPSAIVFVTLQWDNADANNGVLNPVPGIAPPVDLTQGGANSVFEFGFTELQLSLSPMRVTVDALSGLNGSSATIMLTENITDPRSIEIPFSSFILQAGTGVDFSAVSAIQVTFAIDEEVIGVNDPGVRARGPAPNLNLNLNFIQAAPAAMADVEVVVTPGANPSSSLDPLLLDVAVSNLGPDATTDVIVSNQLPSGVTFDAGNSDPAWMDNGGGLLTVNLGTLDPSASTNLAITAIVDDCCMTGDVTNAVAVTHTTSDPVASNNMHTLTITLEADNVPPMIIQCIPDVFIGCNPVGDILPEPAFSDFMVMDNCTTRPLKFIAAEMRSTNGCLVTLTRTLAVVDDCGNTNTCDQLITWIEDFEAPDITQCAPDMDLGCNPMNIPPADTNAVVATDNCGISDIQVMQMGVTNGCLVTLTRTYTVVDCGGNSTNCDQVITWTEDTEPPSLNGCPPGMDLGCNPMIPAADTNAILTAAFDNCGITEIQVHEDFATNGCTVTLTRTFVLLDACNNSNSCERVFTWTEDLEPPQFSVCPISVFLGCNPALVPPADTNAVTVSDNCGLDSLEVLDLTLTNGCNITLTRTFTATDICGNTNTCVQILTWIDDTETPSLNECPPGMDLGCNPASIPPADTNLVLTSSFDACGIAGVFALDETVTNGCDVTLTRTYLVIDGCGNSNSCEQVFTWIEDTEGPVITDCPLGGNLGCNPAMLPLADPTGVVASDSCGPVTVLVADESAVTNGCTVTLTFSYEVYDACSNMTPCATVHTYTNDLAAPVFAAGPTSLELTHDSNCAARMPDVRGLFTVMDDCGPATLTQLPPIDTPLQGPGTFTAQIIATDICGNTSETNLEVVIDCPFGVAITKSVYRGHDEGASCAGTALLIGTNDTPITYCFEITNTGTVDLVSLTLTDPALMIPPIFFNDLPVGVSTSFYHETTIHGSLTNTAFIAALASFVEQGLDDQVRARPAGIVGLPNANAMAQAIVLARSSISDTVWLDSNLNRFPDENLSAAGIPGVTVNLFMIDLLGARNLLANTVTRPEPGNRGFYVFTNVPPGSYVVEVDPTTLPTGVVFPTTPISQPFMVAAGQVITNADFGFRTNPTEITLAGFEAFTTDEGVTVSWRTESERNNLGYYLYRSATINGARTLLNATIIDGQGTGAGADYQLLDPNPASGTHYYWLEDVDFSLRSQLHGPAVAQVAAAQTVMEAQDVGMHKAPAGQVFIDGLAVPVIQTDDGVIYFLPDTDAVVTHAAGKVQPMELVNVAPGGGEPLKVIEANDGATHFTTEDGIAIYLLIGFNAEPIVLDVTNPLKPKHLLGAILEKDTGTGVYLSYPAGAKVTAETVE